MNKLTTFTLAALLLAPLAALHAVDNDRVLATVGGAANLPAATPTSSAPAVGVTVETGAAARKSLQAVFEVLGK